MLANDRRPKTLKVHSCKNYIGIILFIGSCFFAKAFKISVSRFHHQSIFRFHLKMSVLQLQCLQNSL